MVAFALMAGSLPAVGNSGKAVVAKGRVVTVKEGEKAVVTSGKSVRLLPGTTIEAGGRLIVKITPVRTNGNLRRKSISNKPADAITCTTRQSVEVIKGYRVTPLPEPESISLSSNRPAGVVPARIQVSNPSELFFLLQRSTFYPIDNLPLPAQSAPANLPVSGWGDCPETIRVMRT